MQIGKFGALIGALLFISNCSGAQEPENSKGSLGEAAMTKDLAEIQKVSHGRYVEAINRNDAEGIMEVLTDEVVYQGAGAPEIVGKPAVRQFIEDYLDSYSTVWEKTPIGFTVNGDWAFERYTYKVTDTNKETGEVTTDLGKGIVIFRRGEDGQWRVAIDGWSSDQPQS